MSIWIKEDLRNKIDGAYREKYKDHQYLSLMISKRTRTASIRVSPRRSVDEQRSD